MRQTSKTLPFPQDAQLEKSLDDVIFDHGTTIGDAMLPGYPSVKLKDIDGTIGFLAQDMCCNRLNKMARHLWLMSTHSSANITPLHRQSLRGRTIVVMEDPGLHLVWRHDCIFIKPVPRYLLSYVFWDQFLVGRPTTLQADRERIVAVALGFLRSYFYLIEYESDFRTAQREELQLLPKGVTWEQFCTFSERLSAVSDDEVSERYQYGELRLTRLNLWAVPLLRQMAYQDIGLQYRDYFTPYFTPLLFIFGVFSVLLSAMQVGLAAEALDTQGLKAFWNVSRWFAVVSIFLSAAPVVVLLVLLVVKLGDECVYAVRKQFGKRRRASEKMV